MDPNAQAPTPPPPPAPEGWAVPQAPASAGSPIVKILLAVGAVALIAVAVIAFKIVTDGPAKIVFTTTDPPAGSTCDIKDLVDSVSSGTDVWLVINFKNTMGDRVLDVTVTKDGEDFDTFYYDEVEGFDCISEVEPFSDLEPGTYKFTAKVDDKIEAEGTLVVK